MAPPRKYAKNVVKKCIGLHCPETFVCKTTYDVEHKQFHNRKCYLASQAGQTRAETKLRACRECGKIFPVKPYQKDRDFYHSPECGIAHRNRERRGKKNAVWTGGTRKWWSNEIKTKSGSKCCVCHKVCTGKSLHTHHLIPRSMGGESSHDNLVCLCNKHHMWIEGDFRRRVYALFDDAFKKKLLKLREAQYEMIKKAGATPESRAAAIKVADEQHKTLVAGKTLENA